MRYADKILSLYGKLYPIEIKSGTRLSKHDTRGIMAFKDLYGDVVQHGLVLYAGANCYSLREGVTALPLR